MAIQEASASATLRVRLLSIAQAKQAPNTARAGHRRSNSTALSSGQARTTAPATIASMPITIRASKFSLNTNQASSAVNTASALSSSDTPEAGIAARPVNRSTGPSIPPVTIAPASHRQSFVEITTAGEERKRRISHSPQPEPR